MEDRGLGLYLIRTEKIIPTMSEDVGFKMILAIVAIGTGIFTFYMKSLLLSKDRIIKGNKTLASSNSVESYYPKIFQRFLQGHIVLLALSESVGIYGLVIMLVTGDERFLLGLLLILALLMVVHFPKEERFQELINYLQIQKNMEAGY